MARERVFKKKVFNNKLRRIEQEAVKASVCKNCGSSLVKNGIGPQKIRTIIGVVEAKRVLFRCLRCREDIYPLDEAISLIRGERMTLRVRERSLWAAGEVSYEKAAAFLKQFAGLEVTHRKIHTMALEEGTRTE